MAPGPTRYVLTCPARSGSTMLWTCLLGHPEICAHGEVLGRSGPMSFYGVDESLSPPLADLLVELRERDPVAFVRDVVLRAGDKRAVGLKLKYEELLLPMYAPVLDALVADTDIAIVHLTRDDLLARYVSQHVAVHVTKVFNVAPGEEHAVQPGKVRLEPEECAFDLERTARRQERIRELFAGHRILEVTYEQLVDDTTATLARVQSFLGVTPRALEPRTAKLARRPVAETVENLDEVAAALAGSPFARFLALSA